MDRIKIVRPLGSGGNSRAFLGKEISSGRKVTVKLCKSGGFNGENVEADSIARYEAERRNLENEARILEGLEIQGVPRLYQKGPEGIVLEFIPGRSLEKVLFADGVFSEKEAVRIGLEIIDILRYLHGRREIGAKRLSGRIGTTIRWARAALRAATVTMLPYLIMCSCLLITM